MNFTMVITNIYRMRCYIQITLRLFDLPMDISMLMFSSKIGVVERSVSLEDRLQV